MKSCQVAPSKDLLGMYRQILPLDAPEWGPSRNGAPSGTRQTCEDACIAWEAHGRNREMMYTAMQTSGAAEAAFCCQLLVRKSLDGVEGAGRTCDIGWGELVPFTPSGDKTSGWARQLPFT